MPSIKPTKTPTYKTPLTAWVMALSLGLTACGGGGSSTATSTPTPTPTPAGIPSATPTPSGTPSSTPSPTPTPTPAQPENSTGATTAAPPPAPSPTPAPVVASDTTCGLPNFQSSLQAYVNSVRTSGTSCGGVAYPAVGAVGWDGQLQNAATAHSTDMATNNFFAHLSPTNGTRIGARALAAGYNYRTVGENIAAGYTSVNDVMAGWLASQSHCANIMEPIFVDMAVSCKINPASTYQYYWTMTLGKRQ